jgi:hypothetical protein
MRLHAFDPTSPHSAAVNTGQQDALGKPGYEWWERTQTGRKGGKGQEEIEDRTACPEERFRVRTVSGAFPVSNDFERFFAPLNARSTNLLRPGALAESD